MDDKKTVNMGPFGNDDEVKKLVNYGLDHYSKMTGIQRKQTEKNKTCKTDDKAS